LIFDFFKILIILLKIQNSTLPEKTLTFQLFQNVMPVFPLNPVSSGKTDIKPLQTVCQSFFKKRLFV